MRLARAEALPVALSDDLGPAGLRKHGERALEWIEKYLREPQRYRVLPRVTPGEIRQRLPDAPPEQPEALGAILDDFE